MQHTFPSGGSQTIIPAGGHVVSAAGLAGPDGQAGVGEDEALAAPLPLVLAGGVDAARQDVGGAVGELVQAALVAVAAASPRNQREEHLVHCCHLLSMVREDKL